MHTILQRVAITNDIELIELYKKIVWPLDKEEYNSFNVFKTVAKSQDSKVFKDIKFTKDEIKNEEDEGEKQKENGKDNKKNEGEGKTKEEKDNEFAETIIKELVRQISVKLSPHLIRIKADFEIICFTFEGIDAIREALMEGIKAGTEEVDPNSTGKVSDKLGVKVI